MKNITGFLFCCWALAFTLQGQGVTSMTFSEFQQQLTRENDTLYVYNFWATWCAPCVRELPHFETLSEKYREQKVKVILVSLDFPEQRDSRVIPFVETKGLQSPVWMLSDVFDPALSGVWIDQVSPEWSGAIPATLMVNQSQEMYAFKEREFTYQELEEWLLSLLNTDE